jgi:antirestriction protein ArdC
MTGIDAVTLPNSAAYLASWLKVLRSDSKMIVKAAARAQRAADLILGVKHATAEE